MRIILSALLMLVVVPILAAPRETRTILQELVTGNTDAPEVLLEELKSTGDPFIKDFVDSWRTGEVYSVVTEAGDMMILHRVSEMYRLLLTNEPVELTDQQAQSLSKERPSRKLRKELKKITDTIDLLSPDASVRIEAARKLGLSQKAEYLPELQAVLEREEVPRVKRAMEEAVIINQLGNVDAGTDVAVLIRRLGSLKSIASRDIIQERLESALESGDKELLNACREAMQQIESRQFLVDMLGNLFRGLSLGSVLLMVSFGLAITFGLMGIINMAHGEFIAIGGYTAYLVQNAFASAFGVQSVAYQWFFPVALPVSFLVAALIGLLCEKTFVRFLYRRPLESLLATWGLSMVMQQVFRLVFGAANVQVNTPQLLLGSFDLAGASLSFTRVFIIGFAIVIVVATWLLLTRTNLGLYIRAVMQNRQMAASIGIPVDRVNSLTFAFGCGLASLAGVVLSQIGNVGPSMGQTYIVDSFMVVVAGSVGNLLGAGVSAMGIGVVDQFLQPTLGPVMGKITVFACIIIFLQWRPGGLFPSKSRSLED